MTDGSFAITLRNNLAVAVIVRGGLKGAGRMPAYLVRACRVSFMRWRRGAGGILSAEWRAIACTGYDWRGAPTLHLAGGSCPAADVNAPPGIDHHVLLNGYARLALATAGSAAYLACEWLIQRTDLSRIFCFWRAGDLMIEGAQ
jgi:hypothetical protein